MRNQRLLKFDGNAPITLYAKNMLTGVMFYDDAMRPLGSHTGATTVQHMVHDLFADHPTVQYRVVWQIEWQEDSKRWQLNYLPPTS